MSFKNIFVKKIYVAFLVLFFPALAMATSALAQENDAGESLPLADHFVIEHDQRPMDLEYARMSNYAYQDLKMGQTFDNLPGWKVDKEPKHGDRDFYAVIFKNDGTHQIVVAFRGTVLSKPETIIEDINGILYNDFRSHQKIAAYNLVSEVIGTEDIKNKKYNLSFTGHSLGAFLSELSVFFSHILKYQHASAVTFESPGSREVMKKMQSHLESNEVKLEDMDMLSYVTYPNLINTLNHHVGSMYSIKSYLSGIKRLPLLFTYHSHKIESIIKYLEQCYKYNTEPPPAIMNDWPVSNDLSLFSSERSLFYDKYQEWVNNKLEISKEDNESFDSFIIHYRETGHNAKTLLALKHFKKDMQEFLQVFSHMLYGIKGRVETVNRLKETMKTIKIPNNIKNYLLNFRVEYINSNPIVKIIDQDKNTPEISIYKFRSELSEYLHNSPDKIYELLDWLEINKDQAEEVVGFKQEADSTVRNIINNNEIVGYKLFRKYHNIPVEEIIKIESHLKDAKEKDQKELKANKYYGWKMEKGATIDGFTNDGIIAGKSESYTITRDQSSEESLSNDKKQQPDL